MASPPSESILVVDDTPANMGVVIDLLGQAGFRVLVAESGDSALEQIPYARPDLVLLDVLMPGLSGIEVCRRLKADAATRDIPVIFMTALTETVDKVAGFAAGGIDYVTKPVQAEEVLARVRTHLEILRLHRALEAEIALRRDAEAQLQDSLDQAVVVGAREGAVHFSTRHAGDLLARYYPGGNEGRLPEALVAWIGSAPREPLRVRRGGGELVVRLFSEGGADHTVMLRLEERVEVSGPEPLRALGLTPREAEVLFWLTQGKTSPEIAIILEAASNTVKKHVQNIFQKLGVENRTAAALKALEVLGLPRPEA